MLNGFLLVLFAVLTAVPAERTVVPDFRDLTMKTHVTMEGHHAPVMTWYFKGPRMRTEMRDPDSTSPVTHADIFQCDQGTRILLNEGTKNYSSVPVDPFMHETASAAPELPQSGGEVTITTDSVDTGERRQVGSYQARRVKTTITVDPGPEAVSRKSTTEGDGWYIDLPGLYCRDNSKQGEGWSTAWPGRRDRVVFKRLGTAARGFAVEETTTKREGAGVFVQKLELLEISEKPLDESLFEVPADYSPASSKPGK